MSVAGAEGTAIFGVECLKLKISCSVDELLRMCIERIKVITMRYSSGRLGSINSG